MTEKIKRGIAAVRFKGPGDAIGLCVCVPGGGWTEMKFTAKPIPVGCFGKVALQAALDQETAAGTNRLELVEISETTGAPIAPTEVKTDG